MKNLLSLFFLLCLFACQDTPPPTFDRTTSYAAPSVAPLYIVSDSIKIEGDLGAFRESREVIASEENLQIIKFTFRAERLSELQPSVLKIRFPSVDINGFWSPTYNADKINFWSNNLTAKASRWAPIMCFINNRSNNRLTLALSDALNQTELQSYIKEEDVHFEVNLKLFGEKMPAVREYSIELRLDTRPQPYYAAVGEVADWWAQMPEYQPLTVPDFARRPMYSTWYSYHQNLKASQIIEECKIAKSLGCEAVIVDDGWQTLDGNRGYAYTGDWLPERIPEMRALTDSIHAVGMKFLLWYSLPFMGEKAKNYPRFKGKYLRHWESQGTYVLDPRYPEVREFIINTYEKALTDWNLDGFKLDFIGWFTATEETELTALNGRDFASVNEATDFLMTEITKRLTTLRPDVLIEFRQPYIGPLMRKYGNMFRAVDCPNNAAVNRFHTTNLRIMAGNTAVHSDMFIWRKEETPAQAALQILNILYSVPQLSVRLEEIPERHLNMIRFWFQYWNDNREVLLDGAFLPSDPGSNYPILTARNEEKQITTVFTDMLIRVDKEVKRADIVNAKGTNEVITDFAGAYRGTLTIYDCEGKREVQREIDLPKGIHRFAVPPSGMLSFAPAD